MSATVDGDGVIIGFALGVHKEDREKDRLYRVANGDRLGDVCRKLVNRRSETWLCAGACDGRVENERRDGGRRCIARKRTDGLATGHILAGSQ